MRRAHQRKAFPYVYRDPDTPEPLLRRAQGPAAFAPHVREGLGELAMTWRHDDEAICDRMVHRTREPARAASEEGGGADDRAMQRLELRSVNACSGPGSRRRE